MVSIIFQILKKNNRKVRIKKYAMKCHNRKKYLHLYVVAVPENNGFAEKSKILAGYRSEK